MVQNRQLAALHFRDWIPDWYMMSTIECGIYSSLVFHIYESGGRLVHKTSLLASLSGLSELEFIPYWSKLKSKFVQSGDYLYHERCTKELKKTFKLTERGQKAAQTRWKTAKNDENHNIKENMQEQCKSITPAIPRNETNTIQNNNKTNTSNINPIFNKVLNSIKPSDSFLNSSSSSDSFRPSDDNNDF